MIAIFIYQYHSDYNWIVYLNLHYGRNKPRYKDKSIQGHNRWSSGSGQKLPPLSSQRIQILKRISLHCRHRFQNILRRRCWKNILPSNLGHCGTIKIQITNQFLLQRVFRVYLCVWLIWRGFNRSLRVLPK